MYTYPITAVWMQKKSAFHYAQARHMERDEDRIRHQDYAAVYAYRARVYMGIDD